MNLFAVKTHHQEQTVKTQYQEHADRFQQENEGMIDIKWNQKSKTKNSEIYG